jgi:hypothetical protein
MSKQKDVYSTPRLTVYGTVERITTEAVGKTPGGGDGAEQWPYGKLAGPEDHLVGYSRS